MSLTPSCLGSGAVVLPCWCAAHTESLSPGGLRGCKCVHMVQDAAKVVLAEKPTIRDTPLRLDAEKRDALLLQLSTLSSVFHKLPHTFVQRQRAAVQSLADLEASRQLDGESAGDIASAGLPESSAGTAGPGSSAPPMDLLGGLDDAPVRRRPSCLHAELIDTLCSTIGSVQAASDAVAEAPKQPVIDLLGGLDDLSVGTTATPPADDPFGLGALGTSPPATSAADPHLPLLSSAHGCQVHGAVVHDGMQHIFKVALKNTSGGVMSGFHVQFNKNAAGVGVVVGNTALSIPALNPGQAAQTDKVLDLMADKLDPAQGGKVQTALKWTELTAVGFVMLEVRLCQLRRPVASALCCHATYLFAADRHCDRGLVVQVSLPQVLR